MPQAFVSQEGYWFILFVICVCSKCSSDSPAGGFASGNEWIVGDWKLSLKVWLLHIYFDSQIGFQDETDFFETLAQAATTE